MTAEDFVRLLTPEQIEMIKSNIEQFAVYFEKASNKKIALRALYNAADNLFPDIAEDVRKQIKCKIGCAHCCHIRAVATKIEAEVAIDYANEKGLFIDTNRLEQQKDLNVEQYIFSKYKRCVFLQRDNTCGIYPVRPMACRTYFVVNDPEWCDTTKHPQHEQAVVNNLPMAYPAMALMNFYDLDSFPKQLLEVLKTII